MFDQNLNRFAFNREKSLEVLIYIASKVKDMYKTLKILYFADKLHLSKYGRFINGDTYIAMVNGPVPSESYDIIRGLQGTGLYPATDFEKSSILISKYDLVPSRPADLSKISKSDIECLDASIETYKDFSFNQLHEASSDDAYSSADKNGEISIDAIAGTLPNSEEVISYLNEMYSD